MTGASADAALLAEQQETIEAQAREILALKDLLAAVGAMLDSARGNLGIPAGTP